MSEGSEKESWEQSKSEMRENEKEELSYQQPINAGMVSYPEVKISVPILKSNPFNVYLGFFGAS